MLHVAICDDEAAFVQHLSQLLDRYAQETGTELKISTFGDGADLTDPYDPTIDLIFLDIQMGIMDGLRTNPPAEIAGYKVIGVTDYATGPEMPRVSGLQKEAAQVLPPANVIEFRLEDDNKVIFRPSGTEPKVKAYLFSKGATRAESEAVRAKLEAASKEILS